MNQYDGNQRQRYSEGELEFDTLRRYKGKQKPVVILIDIDQHRLETGDVIQE